MTHPISATRVNPFTSFMMVVRPSLNPTGRVVHLSMTAREISYTIENTRTMLMNQAVFLSAIASTCASRSSFFSPIMTGIVSTARSIIHTPMNMMSILVSDARRVRMRGMAITIVIYSHPCQVFGVTPHPPYFRRVNHCGRAIIVSK